MGKTISRWLGQFKLLQSEKGLGLVEVLISIAIIGTVITTLVAALSTGSIAVGEAEQEATSQSLARTQLEHIKSSTYNSTYTKITEPPGYTLAIDVATTWDHDANIQKITVTVFRDGVNILAVEDYKVKR